MLMSWPEEMNVLRIKFSDFFSVFFLYVCLVILTYLFHDSSYIKRQTLSGGGGVHIFSQFAFNTRLHLSI